ncbi:hypothetical protein JOD29_000601 [Lysinibacillus composti]|uniref:Uncharacterized protein n=1 Tax=Lysinibacillus composti TaxID=720633 RepID=A0A3N9UJC1_9BACI|nr:hypothetical protein [Lysinibacillus composti]MBM7607364.1 hypothetical protein [Lysinibacillus composti]RQW76074.1 hypothetical protein EBB45_00535 [Lysinibacillus composti]
MYVVTFFEKNTFYLSQLLKKVPQKDEAIKIKGRKGTVLNVEQIDEKNIHVRVELEKVVKFQPMLKDDKKRRR